MNEEQKQEVTNPRFNLEWIERQVSALQQLANRGVLPSIKNQKTGKAENQALEIGKKMFGELTLFYLRGLDVNLRQMLQEEADFTRERAVAMAAAAQAPKPEAPVDPKPAEQMKVVPAEVQA